jgi:hypothetical protein
MKRTNAFAIVSVAAALLLSGARPSMQQPASPGGAPRQGGRGGGGFKQPGPRNFNEHDGWTSMFDGKSLAGWSGDAAYWKVEDGAITVESSCEKPTGTIYLVWQGGEAADFEMKLEMKGTGDINSGIQYRGWIVPPAPPRGAPAPGAPAARAGGRGPQGPCPSGAARGTPPSAESQAKWNMAGAQYDFDAGNRYTGQYYEQATGRGIIAWKGQIVRTMEGDTRQLLATVGDQASVDAIYKPNDWNELHIIAVGNQMTHLLNGRVISILVDEDTPRVHKNGIIGLEVESTGKLFVRNVWMKKL